MGNIKSCQTNLWARKTSPW